MIIGAVLSEDENTVVPLVGGPLIRIRDTETGEETNLENPAIHATQGRRMAALQAMLQKGVEVVVSPPEAFCAHSYKVARTKEIRFWNVQEGVQWPQLWEDADAPASQLLTLVLPEESLASHHHHHHSH